MDKNTQLKAGYKVFPERQLIIHIYEGIGTTNALLAYTRFVAETLDATILEYQALFDSRKMDWNFLINDIDNYIQKQSEFTGIISSVRKIAGLYDKLTPHQMVYTKKLHKCLKDADQPEGYFTDIPSAIDWLGVKITPEEVQETITEISQNPQFIWKEDY